MRGILTTMTVAFAFAAAPALQAQGYPAVAQPQEGDPTFTGVAQERGFGEWTRGVQDTGLQADLDARPHTAFIADDAAYQQVPGTRTQAWQTDPDAHRAAVRHTIIEGRYTLDELRQRDHVTTIDGTRVPVRAEGDRVWIGDAEIREGDIAAGTGMIHQVDRVTWPDQPAQQVQPGQQVQPDQPAQQVQPDQPAQQVQPVQEMQQPVREPVRKY